MSIGKRLLAVLGLATVVAVSSASPASAYPDGVGPVVGLSSSVVTAGGTLTVSGSHFRGTVTLVGHSAAVDLGTTEASGPEGRFSKTVTITAEDFPPGDHTIEATDAYGDSLTVGFTVAAAGSGNGGNGNGGNGNGSGNGGSTGGGGSANGGDGGGGLAYTGVAVISVGALGVLLLIGGSFILVAGRRRKATI